MKLPKKIMARIVPDDISGCWTWIAHIQKNGYGSVYHGGKNRLAHRAVYELLIGPIAPGLQIDHLCKNKHCVNPVHLEPVTPLENNRRSPLCISTVNVRKTHCKRGHEFTIKNTYLTTTGRCCRKCSRDNLNANRARKRVESTKC